MAKTIILTALDIGTFSIKGMCVKKNLKTGELDILAQVKQPCFGVRNGEIIKPEKISQSIQATIKHLEQIAGVEIKDAIVNINGRHILTTLSQGVVSVSRADQKISKEDVGRAIEEAKTTPLPSNYNIIDVIPQEFIVDGEGGIKNPLNLKGIRLEAKALIIAVFTPILDNLQAAMKQANLEIIDNIPSPLATSRAVLSAEQKELGVCLIDIGAATTSVSVFEKGDLIDFAIYPIGSANITNDIALSLRTEIKTAEEIKKNFATLKQNKKSNRKEKIKIEESSLTVPSKLLKNIVEARVEEVFTQIQKTLKKTAKENILPAGLVFAGGGSKLPGIIESAKQKLKLPCKKGSLRDFPLQDIEFATCAGLIEVALDDLLSDSEDYSSLGSDSGFAEKLKNFFKIFSI